MLARLRTTVERCNVALGMVSGLGVLVMGLILCYEVVCRYFFNAPTIWAQETATYLYMWTMLAAASYTLQEGKHVAVDLVLEYASPRLRNLLAVVTGAIGSVFCAVVTVQAYQMIAATIHFGKVSATPLRVPLWIPQSALLLGFVLLTFQFAFLAADRVMALGGQGEQKGTSA